MSRSRIIQVVCVAGMVLCLALAGSMQGRIDAQRRELQLGLTKGLDDRRIPPTVLLAVAAGGPIRGLMINALWQQSVKLKDEGKFYASNQLAEWITSLQPNYPPVWQFQAWNMAYNISVATNTPAERWEWVNRGINLLRDRGIVLNPRSVRLYKELAWIFSHKIGGESDEMHWHYKRELAMEWQLLMGPPAPADPDDTPNEQTQAYLALRAIADAPDRLDDLLASKPAVKTLVQEMSSLGYKADRSLLHRIGRMQAFAASFDARLLGQNLGTRQDLFDARLVELLSRTQADPSRRQALDDLLSFLRKRALVDDYNMRLDWMLHVVATYGPVDWRHPASHGLYWSSMGVDIGQKLLNRADQDLLNTMRMVIFSLQDLADSGRVIFDPFTGRVDLLPDPRFFPVYGKAVDVVRGMEEQGLIEAGMAYSIEGGHENFLLRAIMFSYLYGSIEQAERYRRDALQYAQRMHNVRSGRYDQPLEQLVLGEITENIDLMRNTRGAIDAMLTQAFLRGIAINDVRSFSRQVALARLVYDHYQTRVRGSAIAPQPRMGLLSFDELMTETYIGFMQSGNLDVPTKARVWINTPPVFSQPPGLRQRAYERVRQSLADQCKREGFSMETAFPAPPGLEDARPATPAGPTPGAERTPDLVAPR